MQTLKAYRAMKRSRWLWVVSALVLLPLLWVQDLSPRALAPLISLRFPDSPFIEAATLEAWMEDDSAVELHLLDVRTAEEYAVSHLRGAVHVDPEQPERDSAPPADRAVVVVYCSVGYRSAAFVEELLARGVGDVYNLDGGIFAWANDGRPLVRDGDPAQRVHPYDALWGHFLRRDLRWAAAGARPSR